MTREEKIARAIRTGRQHARTAPRLEKITGIPERTIRRVISDSPELQPVALPGIGFFWPDDVEDIHAADNILTEQIKALKKKQRLYRAFWKKQGIAFPAES